MACKYPMWAVKYPDKEKPGKWKVEVLSHTNPNVIHKNKNEIRKNFLKNGKILIQIPCGKCIECRLKYSKEWANRCMLEAQQYKYNQFITLTYDDEHLPKTKGIDLETGELTEVATLKKKDLIDFVKRVRIHWKRKYGWEKIITEDDIVENNGIRLFQCGEYGELRKRPHYHQIMFNMPVFDIEYWYTNKKGFPVYKSDELTELWGKGIVALGEVCWETCAYTARYILKKIKGKESKEYYEITGRTPEFVTMSRNPGIAYDFYKENKNEIYEYDEIWINTNKGTQRIKPARYYDKLYDIDEHELMEEIKRKRIKIAENKEIQELKNTDLTREEYLINKLEELEQKLKTLKRNYETGEG